MTKLEMIKRFPVSEYPNITVLAITNECSHCCSHCQYSTYSTKSSYKKQYMEFRIYKKIVDELSGEKNAILRLCAWGEPLFHPEIVQFLSYATEKNVKTLLLTNGYLLTPELAISLMEAGLKFVEVSIDAARISTYKKVRRCKDASAFDKVNNNVLRMVEMRNFYDFQTKIVVSYVTWPTDDSEQEFKEFHNKWVNVTDDVVKRRLHSFHCAIDPELVVVPEDRLPCYGLWGRAIVNPYGDCVLCYNQWEKDQLVLGDLNDKDTTIKGIWNGEEINRLRKNQINNIYEGPCANCKDYNPYAWDHPFEEVLERISK